MCNQQKNSNNSSLFIMGLIIGAIIASAILLTSTEDKQKVIKKIKDKFNDLFKDKVKPFIKKEEKIIKKEIKKIDKIRRDARSRVSTAISEVPKKISVILPSGVETLNLTPAKTIKPKKVFKKSNT